ncbi:MAG: aldo/keto reductase [Leptospiraceae bacterium]|nr:aldo/keto reductase [Leptospiraceae bacterium]
MKYKQLGNSGLVVSELAFGTMTFGAGDFYGLKFTIDQSTANRMISKCIESGINLFDTADMYCNGVSEEILGKSLGSKRKEILIATKVGFRAGTPTFKAGINRKHIIESVEASLKRLNTDFIDVYILHIDDPITPIEETLDALNDLVASGKIRYGGFSNFQTYKAVVMHEKQIANKKRPLAASQMHYSLLNREIEYEFVPFLNYTKTGLMVWSPLSSGFLSGKYTHQNPKPDGARLNDFDIMNVDRELGYKVVDLLKEIASIHNASPSQIAIAWLLSKSYVTTVIIGASKESQLDDNLKSVEIGLTNDEIQKLDELTKPKPLYPNSFQSMLDPILSQSL